MESRVAEGRSGGRRASVRLSTRNIAGRRASRQPAGPPPDERPGPSARTDGVEKALAVLLELRRSDAADVGEGAERPRTADGHLGEGAVREDDVGGHLLVTG